MWLFVEAQMTRPLTLAIILGLLGISETAVGAKAQISVHSAVYKGGILVIAGTTSKQHQTIELDGRYRARSDRNARFMFRVKYLPHRCVARLTSGTAIFHVRVAGCRPNAADL